MKFTRRSALQMSAAPVVVAAVPAVASIPPNHVLHKGQLHPVNAHWHEANTAKWPHLAVKTRQELRDIQDVLLLKSNDPRTTLSKPELDYLRAANNHFDVRTALDMLDGRRHGEFGFEGVDQVHMNSISYACGCKLLIVFDHHKGRAGEVDKIHPHPPLAVCDDHAPHRHDLALLHERVAADSRARA